MRLRSPKRSFLLLPLLLAGCARHAVKDSSVVVLHVADWGGASSDPQGARVQHEIDAEWTRTHPKIHIEMEHIPGSGEYVSKMLTAFVAGTEPDVMFLDDASAAAFINNNTLRDLMPFARQDHLNLTRYFPNVLDIARRSDHLYALPGDFTPMMMYYNKRLFDQAGLPYPRDGWTWDQFHEDCKRLTVWPKGAPHPRQYGFLAENWMPGWIPWIWQNGGDVLTPGGHRATGAFDSQPSVQAVQFFTGLVKDRLAPSVSEKQALGADPFQTGVVAMEISGHWNIVGLKASETLKIADVGVVGLPQRIRRVTPLYESGPAMTRRCRHPQQAWEYIKFLAGPFVQQKKAELGVGISAIRSVAESRRRVNALEPVFLDNVRYGIAPWGARVEDYSPIEDIGKETIDEILVENRPVGAALHAAAIRMDAELAPDSPS